MPTAASTFGASSAVGPCVFVTLFSGHASGLDTLYSICDYGYIYAIRIGMYRNKQLVLADLRS